MNKVPDLLISLLFKVVIEIQSEYRYGIVQLSFLPVLISVKLHLPPLYLVFKRFSWYVSPVINLVIEFKYPGKEGRCCKLENFIKESQNILYWKGSSGRHLGQSPVQRRSH